MRSSAGTPKHPIRAVARLTSIPIETLRAWERRYRIVEPQRDRRGRIYDESDIAKLKLLRVLVSRGHAIGRLAGLSMDELEALAAAGTSSASTATGEGRPLELEPLLLAIQHYDLRGVDRQLGRLAALLPPRDLILQVAFPLLRSVGDAWYAKRMSLAQVQLSSSSLHHLLGALVRLHERHEPHSTILFSTLPGERHELGILAAAVFAIDGGLGVLYLGPGLPESDIARTARRSGVKVVVLGITGAEDEKQVLVAVRSLTHDLAKGAELWVGGAQSQELAPGLREAGATCLADFSALEDELVRLGAKF